MNEKVRIVAAGAERLDEVEPLWRALHAHHALVGSDVAPLRSESESWFRRRAEYEDWLAGSDAKLLLAEGAAPLGYLMLRLSEGPPTWAIGERVAEVETVSILPEARGRGVGALLMAAAREEARRFRASTLSVALVHTNAGARRFYESEGFTPFYVSMLAPVER